MSDAQIRWNLPPSPREQLSDRVGERQIAAEDLYKLKLWRESEPGAPVSPWYKDGPGCGHVECPALKSPGARTASEYDFRLREGCRT